MQTQIISSLKWCSVIIAASYIIAARVNKQGGERFKERFRFTVSSLLHVPDMRESYFIVMTNFVMKLNDHVTS